MLLGAYQGASALSGLERWQSVITQNIANSTVPGYKSTEVGFSAKENGTLSGGFDALLKGQIIDPKAKVDFNPGQLVSTGNPMDLALTGEGYFEMEMADGRSLYSRDGQFHVNSNNELVNKNGFRVLGQSGVIELPPGGGPLVIGEDGSLTKDGLPVEKLSVVQIDNPEDMLQMPGGFAFEDPVSLKQVEDPKVARGFYESSNVSTVKEMVDLISVTRAYEANQKVINQFDESMGRFISVLGNVN